MWRDVDKSLWQLLMISAQGRARELSCQECFEIFQYLADTRAELKLSAAHAKRLARRHLEICPDCRDYYLKQIEHWEATHKNSWG